jgi:hypothetical protein
VEDNTAKQKNQHFSRHKNMNIQHIRIIHSAVWVVMVAAIAHLLFIGVTGKFHWSFWISFGLLIIEGITLLLNKGSCPFTLMAKSETPTYQDGDDIFLPVWVAKHNKLIFGSILALALILILLRLVMV